MKYTDSEGWEQFKAYTNSIKSGELTPLTSFELYKSISNQIDKELVNKTTSNGTNITGKSKHFVSRVIGSVEQKRNGVSINDICTALTSPSDVRPIVGTKGRKSQKYILNDVCIVSINPETGTLIQVNPYSKSKRG